MLNVLMRHTGTSQSVQARMEWANAIILANGGSTLWSRNIGQEWLSTQEDWVNKNG